MGSTSRTPLLQKQTAGMSDGLVCLTDPAQEYVAGVTGTSLPSPACTYYETAHPVKGYVKTTDNLQIYFEVHGLEPGMTLEQAAHRPKVLMIMGLACSCSGWRWQLQDLVQQHKLTPDFVGGTQQQQQQTQGQPQVQLPRQSDPDAQRQWEQQHTMLQQAGVVPAAPEQEMLVCIMDNRGVGNSSSPLKKQAYSTTRMAQDALAVMNELQWERAHILGFSMGGMIAQSLAVLAPQRVQSLTLLGTSRGGFQIIPHSWKGLKVAFKMVMARTPEDAVDATLRMHFRRRTLKAWVTHLSAQRQELLRREYMTPLNGAPVQPTHGFKGQLHACWTHKLSDWDARAIVQAGFPVLVIHGRNDKLASAANAEALARRLQAPCVILPGAHFIVRECAGSVNMLLSSLVLGPQHIQSVANGHYLDPSPAVQRAWIEAVSSGTSSKDAGNSKHASGGACPACSSTAELDLGKLKV